MCQGLILYLHKLATCTFEDGFPCSSSLRQAGSKRLMFYHEHMTQVNEKIEKRAREETTLRRTMIRGQLARLDWLVEHPDGKMRMWITSSALDLRAVWKAWVKRGREGV